jgi:hypothetical protein
MIGPAVSWRADRPPPPGAHGQPHGAEEAVSPLSPPHQAFRHPATLTTTGLSRFTQPLDTWGARAGYVQWIRDFFKGPFPT